MVLLLIVVVTATEFAWLEVRSDPEVLLSLPMRHLWSLVTVIWESPSEQPIPQCSSKVCLAWSAGRASKTEHLGPQFDFEDPKASVLDSPTPKA